MARLPSRPRVPTADPRRVSDCQGCLMLHDHRQPCSRSNGLTANTITYHLCNGRPSAILCGSRLPDGDVPPTCLIRRFRKNSSVAPALLVTCGLVTVVTAWINMHVGSVFMQRGTGVERLGIKAIPARDLSPPPLLSAQCDIQQLRSIRVEPTAYTREVALAPGNAPEGPFDDGIHDGFCFASVDSQQPGHRQSQHSSSSADGQIASASMVAFAWGRWRRQLPNRLTSVPQGPHGPQVGVHLAAGRIT